VLVELGRIVRLRPMSSSTKFGIECVGTSCVSSASIGGGLEGFYLRFRCITEHDQNHP